ncbi:hypothetical protein TNCV_2231541 [Trichonephila clavipes]|nr:hypothetical protein TNCV_2231541 [Trichonephila clavipes]
MVTIHSAMVAEWAGLVRSQAKPVEVYSQEVMSDGQVKVGKTLGSFQVCLGIRPTMARVSHGFLRLFVFWSW